MRHRESRTEAGVLKYRCTACGRWKPVGAFYALPPSLMPYSRCKIRSRCKRCDVAARVRLRERRAGMFTTTREAA
jgi:hypothetical protein